MGCSPPTSWYFERAEERRRREEHAQATGFSPPADFDKPGTCRTCGAAVGTSWMGTHARWHKTLDAAYQSSLLEQTAPR